MQQEREMLNLEFRLNDNASTLIDDAVFFQPFAATHINEDLQVVIMRIADNQYLLFDDDNGEMVVIGSATACNQYQFMRYLNENEEIIIRGGFLD